MTQDPESNAGVPAAPGQSPPGRSTFTIPPDVEAYLNEVASILATELPLAEGRETRAVLQHGVSEFDERMRGDELAAARGYLIAFNSRPSYRPPLDALIRLYARRRSVSNLSKLYDALAKAAATDRDRAGALALKAELLEDRLNDRAGAREVFERAVTTDPSCRVAWMGLERIALRDGDGPLLTRVLSQLAAVTSDASRRARLLSELANERAREGTPEALDEAVGLLREAAALPGGKWRALTELERLAERTGRWADVVFALEGRAALAEAASGGDAFEGGSGLFSVPRVESAEDARRVAAGLWLRAARIRLSALGDHDGSRTNQARCTALVPDDARYRFLTMILADQAHEIERASADAAWLLERGFGDASLRASLKFRIAETAALAGDLSLAANSLRESIALNPESAAARGALIEQLVATGDGAGVVAEFDALAESTADVGTRASLRRAAALYALAINRNVPLAIRLMRRARDDEPTDAVARRTLVALLARSTADSGTEGPASLVAEIDGLLPLVIDDDERTALLLQRFDAERYGLRDYHAAARTAEHLVEASHEAPWALETAALLWASTGEMVHAARWAQALVDLKPDGSEVVAWRSIAARWTWAAGDTDRALEIAVAGHKAHPADDYLTALTFRLALAKNDLRLALDVAIETADRLGSEPGATWLVVAAEALRAHGANESARAALDAALERAPASPVVRAAVLSRTRWRGDAAARTTVSRAALESENPGGEEIALGIELALVDAFVEHDTKAAAEVVERIAGFGAATTTVVSLLQAIVRGAMSGPDAPGAVDALQRVLQNLPTSDPMRVGIELELARALGGSSVTREQAVAARELVDEDQPHLVAPRLLALLDAIGREGREDIPAALGRVADIADATTASALRGAAIAALKARGRIADARTLALRHPGDPTSVVLLSECPGGLDRAGEYADALSERGVVAQGAARADIARAAVNWYSLAGRNADALKAAETLLAQTPDDLIALDVKRVAGRREGNPHAIVDACEALAARVASPDRAARFWEEAGVVSIESLRDTRRAETCLRAALDATPTLDLAYRKLREILESRRDTAGLESLVTRRVQSVASDGARVELLWEQARLRRALGRREAALESAMRVVAIDPNHVAALALTAEVYASSGRLAETADALVALAVCQETPKAQRRQARLGALELFDSRLKRPDYAVEQLEALVAQGDADDALIERGIAIASRAELWDAVLRLVRRAADRAPVGPERAAAMLRVAHVYRDRLRDPAAAREHALAAHDSYPGNLEVLQTLQGLSDPDDRPHQARRTLEALRESARTAAITPEVALAVADAARSGGDGVLERAAVRLARALGDASFGAPPPMGAPVGASLRDPALVLRYRSASDSGRAVVLLETVLPELTELSGLSTDGLGVGRNERIRGSHPLRTALAPYAAAVGYGEFELFAGGSDPARIAVIPGEVPTLVVGRGVDIVADEAARFELVRVLLLAARGVAPLSVEAVEIIAAQVMAALAYAELPIAGGTARFEAHLRPVAKAVSRRVRRAVAEGGRAIAAEPDGWGEIVRGAKCVLSTARRGAMAVTGALPAAFADLSRVEGTGTMKLVDLLATAATARDLGLFALSDASAQIARETGVDQR